MDVSNSADESYIKNTCECFQNKLQGFDLNMQSMEEILL